MGTYIPIFTVYGDDIRMISIHKVQHGFIIPAITGVILRPAVQA
jgi:hypothetical protein